MAAGKQPDIKLLAKGFKQGQLDNAILYASQAPTANLQDHIFAHINTDQAINIEVYKPAEICIVNKPNSITLNDLRTGSMVTEHMFEKTKALDLFEFNNYVKIEIKEG